MAKVFKRVGGMSIERYMAMHPGVQLELRGHATTIARKASANLAALPKRSGDAHSHIEVSHGDIDYYVELNDDRGWDGAMAIERGRTQTHPHGGANVLGRAIGRSGE